VRGPIYSGFLILSAVWYPTAANGQTVSQPWQGPEWNEARKYYETGGAEVDQSVRNQNESTIRNFLKAAKSRKYAVMKSFVANDAQLGIDKGEAVPNTVPGGGPPTKVLTYAALEVEQFVTLIKGCRLIGLISMYKAYPSPKKMDTGFVMTGWRCARSKDTLSWNFHVGSNQIVSIDDRTISL
jgi:hypothetical protein